MATDIQDVHTDNFDEMVLSAQRPVLLEFYATWCASCRRLAPVLERLAAEFAAQVAVMRVNVDENPALVDRFGVSAAPTLVMVIAGEESVRMVGAHAEPAIRELIATTLDRQPACTLPTAQQPMRVAEFDDLLADAVTWVQRRGTTRLLLGLPADPAVAARTADLAVRESDCCSFFTFALVVNGERVQLEVTVPETRIDVLDGLASRATAGLRS